MRRVTRILLWLYVFSVPWEFVLLPGVGAISRLFGIAAIGAGALTVLATGRVRRPSVIFWAALAFTAWSVLTLLWTVDYADSVQRVFTFGQLLASLWLVSEFARTREERQALLVAFCAGAFVPVTNLLQNYASGAGLAGGSRFTATGQNANDMGLTLVLGIPMAWHLVLHSGGAIRMMAAVYVPVALVGMLLTGTRGAFVAAVVALAIMPLTLPVRSFRSLLLTVAVLVATAYSLAVYVPPYSWERMSTIQREAAGEGTLTGRVEIWEAGLHVFQDRPVIGFGAGAFGTAVAPLVPEERMRFAHNAMLAVLVEQGTVGLFLFLVLVGACVWTTVGLRPPERVLWAVLMSSWLVGVMSLNWDYRKVTWLFFGLLAAQRRSVISAPAPQAPPGPRYAPADRREFQPVA